MRSTPLRAAVLRVGFGVAILIASADFAQAQRPPASQGAGVRGPARAFHSGNPGRPTAFIGRPPRRAGGGHIHQTGQPGAAFGQFTLTLRNPVLAGRGSLQAIKPYVYGNIINQVVLDGGVEESGGLVRVVVQQATAGKTYRIDELFKSSSTGCRFKVRGGASGPGVTETFNFPCSKTAGGDDHLIIRYVATKNGQFDFDTTLSPGANALFYSATVGVVK